MKIRAGPKYAVTDSTPQTTLPHPMTKKRKITYVKKKSQRLMGGDKQ